MDFRPGSNVQVITQIRSYFIEVSAFIWNVTEDWKEPVTLECVMCNVASERTKNGTSKAILLQYLSQKSYKYDWVPFLVHQMLQNTKNKI